ncbi:MAG: disulfide bond formation protein B [Rhodanobacteraceae bacterium]|nr:MAG: disulfide bond formation protein B [Rhodanobacteraceae bacterium]
MNPFRWSFRTAFLIGFAICVALLGYALYEELYQGQMPCYLCVMQRVAFVWMGVFFLIGGLHAPRAGGRRAYVVLVLIGAVFGIAMSVRQLWLQSLPADQVPACGASFGTLVAMLQQGSMPFGRFLAVVLHGDGNCAAVTWKFLGLSMAGWALIWYVLLGVWALLPRPRRGNRLSQAQPLRALRS